MSKYRIRLLYDVTGWAYYNRCMALKKYVPADFEVSIGGSYGHELASRKHDLVLQLAFSYVEPLRRVINRLPICKDTVLLTSYNVGYGYRDHWFNGTLRHSDHMIVNNREMWHKMGRLENTTPISNGVDGTIFKPSNEILKPTNKVLWCGSKHHRTVKGYDSLVLPLAEKLKKEGIVLDHRLTDSSRPQMNQAQMAEWYQTGDVYLVTSKNEGTPNPALEAASSGCALVSTRVGNMPELIKDGRNGYLCDRQIPDLYNKIKEAMTNKYRLSQQMLEDIKPWHWENRSKDFFDLFRRLIEERKNR